MVDTRAQCNWYKVQKDTSSSMKRESKHYKTPEYFDFNSACTNIETTNKSLIHWFWKFWTIKFLFLDQFELNFMIKSKLTLKLANGMKIHSNKPPQQIYKIHESLGCLHSIPNENWFIGKETCSPRKHPLEIDFFFSSFLVLIYAYAIKCTTNHSLSA